MGVRTYAQALAAIGLWSTLAFLSTLLTAMPPFLLVGIGLLIGSLCGVHRIREWAVPWPTLLMGVYGLFGFHFFLFVALRNAPPVEANLINYLWPLLIVVLSPVFLQGYQLKPKHLLASGLGFFGAFLIVTDGKLGFTGSGSALLGYACAGVSAIIWATYSLLSKRVPPFPTSAVGLFCLVSGAASLACHFAMEPAYSPSAREWPSLLVLGCGPMGAAFFLWDASLKDGDPRVIGSLAYLTPMLSTLLLIASGHGTLTAITGVAMALIIGGAVTGSWSKP